jgi:hypothetical protein
MDYVFLYCSQNGINPEPAWAAYKAADNLLEIIQDSKQEPVETLKVVGL